MRELTITHFDGEEAVHDIESLDLVLRKRSGPHDANEFYLSGSQRYPVLAIAVRGQVACVHYYPFDGHAGFQSRTDSPQPRDGEETFYITPTEEIEMVAESVVSFDDARRAAHEFASSDSLPTSLRWLEL